MTNERETQSGDGESNDGRGNLDRRDYMRAMGSVGLASALGGLGALGASSTAAAATADTSKTADERIEEHRTGTLEVVVENSDGSPVENATVSVEQQSHDFRWGTAVHADTLINQSSPGDNYREYIPELFNTAVMENQHKWGLWEDNRQLADDATDWILEQGLDMRGHVCVYGVDYAIPDDVQTAIDEGDTQTIRDRSMQHIDEIVSHYGDRIHEWEVVNEVQHATTLTEPFTDDPETAQIVADWYQRAQDVRPGGVSLAVNDYNAIAGNYGSEQSGYRTHIQHLLDNGIDLQTTGLQCHFGRDETLSNDEIIDTLNEYGRLTDTLKITEYDQAGSDWDESAKADWFERFLRMTFSHPGVESFLVWGFWDGRHWEDDAPFFYDDWSTKPSYDVWMDLVYGEWWTDETGTTDDSGTYTTNAFLGEHRVSASTDSDSSSTTVSIDDSSGTTTVTVTVSGDGDGGGDDDDDDPGDGNGDGDYIAVFEPSTTSASVGERITFQVEDTTGDGTWIDSLEWAFGDGTTGTGWWNEHTYDSAGTYTVSLTATDNEGTATTFEVEITVS